MHYHHDGCPSCSAEQTAWECFAGAHPHEAHAKDPNRFWAYFQGRCPGVTREEMARMLAETSEPQNTPPTEGRRVPGLLPVDQWVKAARSDEFYEALVNGCFADAEDLARFLLQANSSLREQLRQFQPPTTPPTVSHT